MLNLDLAKLTPYVTAEQLNSMADEVAAAHSKLYDPSAPVADFTGWVRLPESYDKEEFVRIQKAAAKIREDSDVLVVIGIGGSYLGPGPPWRSFPPTARRSASWAAPSAPMRPGRSWTRSRASAGPST